MLLTIDMGNTNITLGVFRGETLLFESRLATDHTKTADQYTVELKSVLRLYEADLHGFCGAILSSVVPALDQGVCDAVRRVTGITPLRVGPGIRTGLNIRIDRRRRRRRQIRRALHHLGSRHRHHRVGGGRRPRVPRRCDHARRAHLL